MNQRCGYLLELAPLERTRAHHFKRRALRHFALQRRGIFEQHRPETHKQPQEVLLGLLRTEYLPQIDVQGTSHDVHDALTLFVPRPLRQLCLIRLLLLPLGARRGLLRARHRGALLRFFFAHLAHVEYKRCVRLQRLSIPKHRLRVRLIRARAAHHRRRHARAQHAQIRTQRIDQAHAFDRRQLDEISAFAHHRQSPTTPSSFRRALARARFARPGIKVR